MSQALRTDSLNGRMRSVGIQLNGLVKSYGPAQAVGGVDLSVAAGETVALLGPNGAGKSTLIDMLVGLTRPDRGTVSVFELSPSEAAKAGMVSVMLQTGGLLPDLSVREMVRMVAAIYPRSLGEDEVLAQVGLEDLADRRTQTLSGGQAQGVRFALAMAANPELLVVDEPTVGMDVAARRRFWAAIRAFAALGRTVVFATHYLEEADAYADRVVLMSHGMVVADGPATEIKAMVGQATIRATLPGVPAGAIAALPGVVACDRHGDSVELTCNDSDAAVRGLLATYPAARDIRVAGADLEQAFVQLTRDGLTENHA